jgi:putative membrane protein
MNRVDWTQVGVFAVVVLLVFLIGTSLLFRFGGDGSWMMGRGDGMMGPDMMGSWSFGPLSWLFMLPMFLLPLGFLALLVAGIAWLVRAASPQDKAGSSASTRNTALDILKERYARGEISKTEYEEMRDDLAV